MSIVLTIIALQQGLFAIGWWVAGSLLGLSRRAAWHWVASALGSAVALMLILQRGHWPDLLTIVVANVLAMSAFLAMRLQFLAVLDRPGQGPQVAISPSGPAVDGETDPEGGGEGRHGEQGGANVHDRSPDLNACGHAGRCGGPGQDFERCPVDDPDVDSRPGD